MREGRCPQQVLGLALSPQHERGDLYFGLKEVSRLETPHNRTLDIGTGLKLTIFK